MRHFPRTGALLKALILVLPALLTLGACEDPGAQLEFYATQAKTSRSGAAANLAVAFNAGQITAEGAINLAHDKLEAGEDTTDFAGAVLDMLAAVEDKLPQGAEFEIFWMRIGQLASRAALTAHNHGRSKEALTLVFAGPKRWQTDHYWQGAPNHDALASIILDENGKRAEAIARLNDRSDLDGPALEVYQKLTGHK